MRHAITALVLILAGCAMEHRSQSLTQKEIRAAADLMFDSEQTSALKAIAAREGLLPAEQAYLVRTAYTRLRFDSSTMAVLWVLIHNPGFSPQAKSAILDGLPHLGFSSDREQVLKALNDRGPLAPWPQS